MEHLKPWFTLKSVTGIGNLLYRRLIDRLGTPEHVLRAPVEQLAQVNGMTPRLAAAIRSRKTPGWVRSEITKVAEGGYQVITLNDPGYPQLLRHIPDPPPLIYMHGQLDADGANIAVVGSRKATAYGRTSARQICRHLVSHGLVVVSGMARGIDTAAHLGALDAGGRTVAVLGSGLGRIYPAENRRLFQQIGRHGAVLTEYAMDAEPAPHHFPQRNRVISGLSLGTVVVEAAQRSGSLITARLAAEQGRDVFAVPGSIHAVNARGTHALIQQGAKLIESADDILEELQPRLAGIPSRRHGAATSAPVLSTDETDVLAAIGPYPRHIDELARQLPLEMGQIHAALIQLELKGIIDREPGQFFIRNADGAAPQESKKGV